jgi:predicted GNAT family acetyltransferase
MTDFNVEHHPQDNRFIIKLPADQLAQLRYRFDSEQGDAKQVDFFNTHVPDNFRGKGLAGLLVDKGFAWADENHHAIKTSCWYAELKLKKRDKSKV